MVECIMCGVKQTHPVCHPCYKILEEEDKWCAMCGRSKDEPVHDWDCFK